MAENGFIGGTTDSLLDDFKVEIDSNDRDYPITVRFGTRTNLFLTIRGAEKVIEALSDALDDHVRTESERYERD